MTIHQLLFYFSMMFSVMTVRPVGAQADCPNEENYSPCTCSKNSGVTCTEIALAEVASVFRRTSTADLNGLTLYLSPTDPTKTIPAELLSNHRTRFINIYCGPAGSPLIFDSQALRSSQNLMTGMALNYCDMSQLNFEFLSGFNLFFSITWASMSSVGQANWASFPALPNFRTLTILISTGFNEWVIFPQLARGLTLLHLGICDIQDDAMNRILNWIFQYSANTLEKLNIGGNELTQIPKQLQAPHSFHNLQELNLGNQKTGIPLITTGSLSCPSSSSKYELYANNNRITTIDAGAFQGNCGSATIYLAKNLLSRFEEATFKDVLIQMGSSTTGILNVKDNPFDCELDSCHLDWLIKDNRDLLNHLEDADHFRGEKNQGPIMTTTLSSDWPLFSANYVGVAHFRAGYCTNGTAFKELNPSALTSCSNYGNPTTTQKTTAKAPMNTTPKPVDDHCPCSTIDHYGNEWIIQPNETKVQNCTKGAVGNATRKCDYVKGQCRFHTNQPDYSQCRSLELMEISGLVMDNETEVIDIWTKISNFTSKAKAYFGHEIFNIFDLVTQLLNRQESEMLDDEVDRNSLLLQINASLFGTETMDNLISNDNQWFQLIDAKRGDEGILKLLEVSNDVSLRLSKVAQLEDQSLLCEISFLNVTISSSYWNGSTNPILNCNDLSSSDDNSNSTSPDDFLRFPLLQFYDNEEPNDTKSITNSYIQLPSSTLVPNQIYKASGVLISDSNLVRLLLPGENNNPGKVEKQVNSPLITFTLYDGADQVIQLPEKSHIQLVYEHDVAAKYPPVRNIYRWLDEGEKPSSVMSSSLCSYLLLNQTDSNDNNVSSIWKWDDKGCWIASSNRTHTVCHCDHLTGFANLMDFHNYLGPSKALDSTSMTCTIISMIGVALTIVILETFRSLKIRRKARTQHLCANFFISFLMILITLNKHFIPLNDVTCAIMGILLHYVLLVSFMWIFIEGIHLYRLTENAITVDTTNWMRYYASLAYGGPLVIVVITVLCAVFTDGIIEVYSGDETCWLVGEKWMWSFGGPVTAILLGNCIATIFVLRASYKIGPKTKDSVENKFVKSLRRLLVLTLLLGITWLTGFLLFSETLVLAFIFTIASGLQGVAIFVTCCLNNKDIRTALKKNFQRFTNYLMGKLPSAWKDGNQSGKNDLVNESPVPPISDNVLKEKTNPDMKALKAAHAARKVVGNDLGGNKSASLYSGSSQDTTYSYVPGSFLHKKFKNATNMIDNSSK